MFLVLPFLVSIMLSPDQNNMAVKIEDELMQEEEPIAAHELVATSSNDDPVTHINAGIIKGKRTKRQRLQSPISFCLALNTDNNENNNNKTANNNDETPESDESRSDICLNIQDTNVNTNTTLISDDCYSYKTKEEEDEEEEEVANCLILLAQGKPRYLCKNPSNDDDYFKQPAEQKKFTSKKFLQTPYGDKAVYECRTCFKNFPSFQALGGHRASHGKPRKDEEKMNNRMLLLDEGKTITPHAYYAPSKTNLNAYDDNHNHINTTSKKPRIHECGTCGVGFLSGQALGGHMRSHRAPTGARVNNVSTGSRHNQDDSYFATHLPSSFISSALPFMTSMVVNTARLENEGRPPPAVEAKKMFLNLDLNLAAPLEDESAKMNSAPKEEYKRNW